MQLLMNIPFTALYFATYESSKKILGRTDEDEGLLVQVRHCQSRHVGKPQEHACPGLLRSCNHS